MPIHIQSIARVATADKATNGVCAVVVTPSIVSGTLINICFVQQYEITFGNRYKINKRFNDKKTIKQTDKTLSSRWIDMSSMTTSTQVGTSNLLTNTADTSILGVVTGVSSKLVAVNQGALCPRAAELV